MNCSHNVIRCLLCTITLCLVQTALAQVPLNPVPKSYDTNLKRLLVVFTGQYINAVSQGQIDRDSAMLFACQIYQQSRLLPYNAGYGAVPNEGSLLIDSKKINAAKQRLAIVKGEDQLQLLAELSAYYVFQPGTAAADIDSALYFARQLHTLSKSAAARKWQLESLRLIGQVYFQQHDLAQSQSFFSQAVRLAKENDDLNALANALITQGTYLPFGAKEKLPLLEEALAICRKQQLKLEEIIALTEILNEHFRTAPHLAEKELLHLLELEKKAGFLHHQYIHTSLSYIYITKGAYDKALEQSKLSISSMEATGDVALSSSYYQRMADVYGNLNKDKEAAIWNKRALDGPRTIQTKVFWYKSFLQRISLLHVNGQAKEAYELLASVDSRFTPTNAFDRMYLIFHKGVILDKLERDHEAEAEFVKYAALARDFPREHVYAEMAESFITIAGFYFHHNNFAKARASIRIAMEVAQTKGVLRGMAGAHFYLYKLDSAERNYISAIYHLKKFSLFRDSVFNLAQRNKINELEIKHETARKDQDIKLLTQQSELQQAKLQQASFMRNIILAGTTLLAIIVGLLYNQYRVKKRSNEKLQRQQDEISQKNKTLQQLLEDKEWLVKEIHHRVKNNLHTIVSLLESQSAYLGNDALAAVRDSQHRIYAMSLIHQKLYLSENVTTIDMSIYIKELVYYLCDSFSISQRIRFQIDIQPISLDVGTAIPLGLILNEAITNSIKYAFPDGPGIITITLTEEEENFLLTISDNGIGLPDDFDSFKTSSLGMRLMKGLSKEIEATFTIANQNGTSIRIAFTDDAVLQRMQEVNQGAFSTTPA